MLVGRTGTVGIRKSQPFFHVCAPFPYGRVLAPVAEASTRSPSPPHVRTFASARSPPHEWLSTATATVFLHEMQPILHTCAGCIGAVPVRIKDEIVD